MYDFYLQSFSYNNWHEEPPPPIAYKLYRLFDLSYIDSELDNYKTSRTITSLEQLRQIQDTIFTERTVTEKVPDWFYRLNKSTNEKFIDNLIIKIQNNF